LAPRLLTEKGRELLASLVANVIKDLEKAREKAAG